MVMRMGNPENRARAGKPRRFPDFRGRVLPPLLAFAVASALPFPVLSQRAGAPGLGVDGLPIFRDPGSGAVLALATDRWQAVSSRSEELLGDFRYLPEHASARAQGQVFRVIQRDLPDLLPDPGGEFVVVPWSFGPGCAEEGWQAPDWVIPGDTVAFLLVPTRVRKQVEEGGNPVFDVLGWHQPYPAGDLIPFWRRTREPNPSWLAAIDFYHLLTLLPSEAALEGDPEGALAGIHLWLQGSPHRVSSFPVTEMLAEWAEQWDVENRLARGEEGRKQRRLRQ